MPAAATKRGAHPLQVPTTTVTIAHPFALREAYEAAGCRQPFTRKVGPRGMGLCWAGLSCVWRPGAADFPVGMAPCPAGADDTATAGLPHQARQLNPFLTPPLPAAPLVYSPPARWRVTTLC